MDYNAKNEGSAGYRGCCPSYYPLLFNSWLFPLGEKTVQTPRKRLVFIFCSLSCFQDQTLSLFPAGHFVCPFGVIGLAQVLVVFFCQHRSLLSYIFTKKAIPLKHVYTMQRIF